MLMPRPLRHINDNELVERLHSDEVAFTEIYHRYWDKLLFIAGTKLKNIALAEELVQDVFFDIWRRRKEIHITGELEYYLAVAIKYRIINAHAKIKRQQALKYDQTTCEHPELVIDERDLLKNLQILVARLPEKCRITYQLSREEGLPLKTIAQKLNVSQKAVEANLTRTLKLLRFGLRKILFLLVVLYTKLPGF